VRPAEDRKEFDRGRQLVLDHMRGATLPVRVVGVDAGTHDQLALMRLAYVDVDRIGHHDAIEHRIEQLGHQRL